VSEKLKIYKDYLDFLDREDKAENGCTQEWLNINKLTIEQVKDSLLDCFNCFSCYICNYCKRCNDYRYCEHCNGL
jgi:hypothetical protein